MKVKRFARVMALSLSLALAVPSVVPGAALTAEAAAKEVTLNKGSKKTLSVSTDKKVTWKSSKTKVATVSKKGVVKALKAGTTTITATYGSKKKTWKVTVPNIKLNLTKATIKRDPGTSTDEGEVQLRVQGLTLEQQQEVTWSTSDDRIAQIVRRGNGLTEAVATVVAGYGDMTGTATITAKYGKIKMTCEVTVIQGGNTNDPQVLPITPVTYNAFVGKASADDVKLNTLTAKFAGYADLTKAFMTMPNINTHFYYTYNLVVAGTAQQAIIDPTDQAGKKEVFAGVSAVRLNTSVTLADDYSSMIYYMPDASDELVGWTDYQNLQNQGGYVRKSVNSPIQFMLKCKNGAFGFTRAIMSSRPITEIRVDSVNVLVGKDDGGVESNWHKLTLN